MASEAATDAMSHPVLLGVLRAPPLPPGSAGPAEPDLIVMADPLMEDVLIFPSRWGDRDPLSALVREVMAVSFAEGARGPPPASRASISAMKAVEAAGGEGECAVCLEMLGGGGGGLKEMPCGHRYHGGCIGRWLGMNGTCPVCRHRMPEEEEEGGAGKA